MIAAAVPLMVTVPLPLLLIVAPAKPSAVSVPLVTLTVVVKVPPSTSATLMALLVAVLNTCAVSSAVLCAPGTVFTGALSLSVMHVHLVGRLSPPFKASFSDDDVAQMLAAINDSGADVLWVAMTAPKQEKWIQAHTAQLDVKLIGAVGAVFDFYAGTVKRSPPIFQRLGLEWLPRVVRAPRRLWRRMLVSAPIFVWHAMKAALQRR